MCHFVCTKLSRVKGRIFMYFNCIIDKPVCLFILMELNGFVMLTGNC